MARYRAQVAYDGTPYQGFQRQSNALTVQSEVEAALTRIVKQPVVIWGAGRTDTGVHAVGQVIGFDADWPHSPEALLSALNFHLPPTIAVQSLVEQAGFYPRHGVQARRYRYEVWSAQVRDPLMASRVWHVPANLDHSAMQRAADLLVGKHDFATFGHAPHGNNTVREVFVSHWEQMPHTSGVRYTYTIEATAFLHHMVRRIVALLVAVGRKQRSLKDFETAFRGVDVKYALPPAPPQGLTLEAVTYVADAVADHPAVVETSFEAPHIPTDVDGE
jgi:tRNA pseudouridine38-40 synthase